MRGIIEAIGEMGGGMVGGTVHSYWPGTLSPELDSKMPIWKQSTRSMRELLPVAEDHGVTLNVEVINRFEQFLLDTFHTNIEEDDFGEAIVTAGRNVGVWRELMPGARRGKPLQVVLES